MINAELVAKYFLSKDNERKLFNMNVVTYNNRNFYEGNARLNKYLFLSQNVNSYYCDKYCVLYYVIFITSCIFG